MNKKLIAIIMAGALSACGQVDSGSQAQKVKAPKADTVQQAEFKVTHMDAVQSDTLMKTWPDLTVIDVRTPGEFAGGRIAGAINIDFRNANFASEIANLDGSKDYLIYCRSGNRSGQSLATFKAHGFSHIIHMDGGMKDWNKANLPMVQ